MLLSICSISISDCGSSAHVYKMEAGGKVQGVGSEVAIDCDVYAGSGKKRFSLNSFGEYTILSLFLMKAMKSKRKAIKVDPYPQIREAQRVQFITTKIRPSLCSSITRFIIMSNC